MLSFAALENMMLEGRSFSGHERHCCFLNTGEQEFADVSSVTGLDLIDDGRAVAMTDWDHDGDIDFWLTNRTSPAVRFLQNDLQPENHFLAFRLQGRTCNRDAIGARVEVHLAGDPQTKLVRTLYAGQGYLSQSSKWLHFGLGKRDAIERIVVRWPGGEAEEVSAVEVDGRYRIEQGSGQAVAVTSPKRLELPPATPHVATSTDAARVVALKAVHVVEEQVEDNMAEVGSLQEISARQGFVTVRTLQMEKLVSSGTQPDRADVESVATLGSETAKATAEIARRLEKLEVDGCEMLFEAEHEMLAAVASVRVGEYERCVTQQKNAQRLLRECRHKVEDFLETRAGPPKQLSYRTWDGREAQLDPHREGAVLVVLWASWCPNCHKELTEIAKHASRLRAAGVEVVVLNVDRFQSPEASAEEANRVLDKLQFPFESGEATQETVARLERAEGILLGRFRPVSIPASFLIEPDNRVRVFYRGPVEVDQVVADVKLIGDATQADIVRAGMAFPGSFARPLGVTHVIEPDYVAALTQVAKRSSFIIAALGLVLVGVMGRALRRSRERKRKHTTERRGC
jgi:peroxiredoxin